MCQLFFFLMIRRPPRSTRTDTLFPYTTLFRAGQHLSSARMGTQLKRCRSQQIALTPYRHLPITPPGWCPVVRSEEHTSELQSLMRISYAVFCLKKKKANTIDHTTSRFTNSSKKENTQRTTQTTNTLKSKD